MKQGILIMGAASLMAISCNQLKDSIHETFNPDSSRMQRKKPAAENTMLSDTVIESSSWSVQISQSTITVQQRTGPGLLDDAATLSAAEQALRALPAFGGKTIYLYQHVHFYNDGRIMARVRHPENEEYVDEYTYQNGQWMEPVPVQLSVRDNIKRNLISLDAVKFARVAEIYKNYTAKAAQIEGAAALVHVYAYISDNDFEWYPQSISGSRERYRISFRRDGSVDRFYRE